MTHYDVLTITILAGLVLLVPFVAMAFYQKGCRDTWRSADEITQVEPLVPLPTTEPQPMMLHSSIITWEKITTNCQTCQDEQEHVS